MRHWLTLLGSGTFFAATTHATEHLAEDVTSATTAALLETVFSVFVVKFTFLTVTEHLVRSLNFLELLGITTTIRVMCSGELEVGLLDSAEVSILIDA